jgi:serine/threonine protein phosphatase 1
MLKLTDWFSRRRPARSIRPRRRRIDLGINPPSYPIYAIGDVHGCIDELRDAEARIAHDMSENRRPGMVILLGDYVDRGPASSHVLEHLIRPSEHGLRRIALCGNHDDIFMRFVDDPERYSEWLGMGGEQTLLSYGLDPYQFGARGKKRGTRFGDLLMEAVPVPHRKFLANLPVSLTIGKLVFVHAGLRPGIPLKQQTEEDMLWIRDAFLATGPQLPLLVIHGHTPQPEPDFGPGRIGIDTGAYYSGRLTVLKIDGGRFSFL